TVQAFPIRLRHPERTRRVRRGALHRRAARRRHRLVRPVRLLAAGALDDAAGLPGHTAAAMEVRARLVGPLRAGRPPPAGGRRAEDVRMSATTVPVRSVSSDQWLTPRVFAGAAAWVAACVYLRPAPLDAAWGYVLLLFSPLVLVPLG